MTRYWIVGASWYGTDHQDQRFVDLGIWMLGLEDGPQFEKVSEMQIGDRIAIKRNMGQGQDRIRILHIGIVSGFITETNKFICTVDWAATNLEDRTVQSRGCFQSVHGPFEHDAWIQEIFCL